jgi:hypothetical protein
MAVGFLVIPGRCSAASPEPKNTQFGETWQNTVFMGSGPALPGHPGMTP